MFCKFSVYDKDDLKKLKLQNTNIGVVYKYVQKEKKPIIQVTNFWYTTSQKLIIKGVCKECEVFTTAISYCPKCKAKRS